jgi:hypothetical protein
MRSRLVLPMMLLAAVALAGCASARFALEPQHAVADLEPALHLIAAGRYVEASASLAPVAATAQAQGRPDVASLAFFWQGYCAEKTAQIAEALRFYGDVVTTYPGTPAARQADERAELLRAAATTTTKD